MSILVIFNIACKARISEFLNIGDRYVRDVTRCESIEEKYPANMASVTGVNGCRLRFPQSDPIGSWTSG